MTHVGTEGLRKRLVDIQTYRALLDGEELVSGWMAVDQAMIDVFAEATHDHQFIHVDPKRAATETPFGGTIAHGFLSLSLLSGFASVTLPGIRGTQMSINYGLDRVRFLAPVPAGSHVRGCFRLVALIENVTSIRSTFEVSVGIENADKPALVATWITLAMLDAPAAQS